MRRASAQGLADWRAFQDVAALLGPLAGGGAPACPPDADWEAIARVSSAHCVAPALGWTLRETAAAPEPRGYFEALLALNRRRNHLIAEALPAICGSLDAAGARPVLLKGAAALADALYPDPGVRFLGDVDILVDESRLAQAQGALAELGYAARPAKVWRAGFFGAPAVDPGAIGHELAMMAHPATGVGVELHRALISGRHPGLLAPAACLEAAVRPSSGAGFAVLRPTDRLVHNVAHMQVHHGLAESGAVELRQVLEFARLTLRDGGGIDWDEVSRRFESAGQADALADMAQVCRTLFGVATPFGPRPEAMAALRRAVVSRPTRLEAARRRAAAYWHACRADPKQALNLLHPLWLAERLANLWRRVSARP